MKVRLSIGCVVFLVIAIPLSAAEDEDGTTADLDSVLCRDCARAILDEHRASLSWGETGIDYRALRFATAAQPGYPEDSERARELMTALNAAKLTGDSQRIVAVSDSMLALNYIDILAHVSAALAHRELGNAREWDFHGDLVRGLFHSIVYSGDGISLESAIRVVDEYEAYRYIVVLEWSLQAEERVALADHEYLKVEVLTSESDVLTRYFDLDAAQKWLEVHCGQSDAAPN